MVLNGILMGFNGIYMVFNGIFMGYTGIYDGYPLVNVYITNWKDPPFLMGKLTISTAMFNSFVNVYQRVPLNKPSKMRLF